MSFVSAMVCVGREVWWWVSGLGGILRRHPRRVLLVVAVLLFLNGVDGLEGTAYALWLTLTVLATVLGLALWCRLAPGSYARSVGLPMWRRGTRTWVRRSWANVMDGAGLSRKVPGEEAHRPVLEKSQWRDDGHLWVRPRLLIGQTVEDVEAAADRLRTAWGARMLRVVPNASRTDCELMLAFRDNLETPFMAEPPNPVAETANLNEVILGRRDDGRSWCLPLRASTLTAGATGAGKGSVMWGIVLSQAPNIRSGLVQFHGADLKGAMELGMGRQLFTRLASTAEEAVVMLEDAVQLCEERAQRLSGVSRMHEPTQREPLVIVLIDELAVLIGYQTDRDLLKRSESALSRLLAVGRAVGFYVFAFLQDPRKETVKMRHLFPQAIGLRLRQKDEIAMVLGDGAATAGARCDRISRTAPGTGYVVTDEGEPVRVRAGFVSDPMIRLTAELFPTPVRRPIVVPAPESGSTRRRTREPGDTVTPNEPKSNERRSRRRKEEAA